MTPQCCVKRGIPSIARYLQQCVCVVRVSVCLSACGQAGCHPRDNCLHTPRIQVSHSARRQTRAHTHTDKTHTHTHIQQFRPSPTRPPCRVPATNQPPGRDSLLALAARSSYPRCSVGLRVFLSSSSASVSPDDVRNTLGNVTVLTGRRVSAGDIAKALRGCRGVGWGGSGGGGDGDADGDSGEARPSSSSSVARSSTATPAIPTLLAWCGPPKYNRMVRSHALSESLPNLQRFEL
jgi:hypothetical protein